MLLMFLVAQRVMWFKVMFLALSLSLLRLGAAQECEGFVGIRGQLKEIQANVAAILRQNVIAKSENETCVTSEELNSTLENTLDVAMEKFSSTLEKIVDAVVEKRLGTAVEKLNVSCEVNKLSVERAIEANIVTANEVVAHILSSLVSPAMAQLQLLRLPGNTPSHPATSCKEIKELNPTAPSGHYWLRDTGDFSVHMYCDMSRSCGGITGGWMQVANINMTDTSDSCPAGLKTLTQPKRLCAMNIASGGCSSASFSVQGVRYTRVCGKIIGYKDGSPDAFWPYYNNRRLTIDDQYVDGISLTHGHNPRKHIWTFAAAVHEVLSNNRGHTTCPCTNIRNTVSVPIPPYVGNDYFCDSASESRYYHLFYPTDPLWDGTGCGRLNTCCSFNNPPWFMKELPSSTSEDIEMRLCADHQPRTDERITFETVELYVQ